VDRELGEQPERLGAVLAREQRVAQLGQRAARCRPCSGSRAGEERVQAVAEQLAQPLLAGGDGRSLGLVASPGVA
jgi:hypothetical protein